LQKYELLDSKMSLQHAEIQFRKASLKLICQVISII